jgi:lysozyme
MRTSPDGIAFLERNEGERLDAYLDEAKILTVGVGHVVLPTDHLVLGQLIDQAECDALLTSDLAKCERVITASVLTPLTQNMFDALVSLTFNIGCAGFLSSTVLKDINAGLVIDVKRAFELWDKDVQAGVKVVSYGLLARRDREVALFLAPDGPPPAA